MSDTPMIIRDDDRRNDGNWGAAGVGGFLGSVIGNGGFFGNGYGRGFPGQVGADVAIQVGQQNIQNAVQQGALTQLQSANGIQQSVANAAAGVTGGIYQNALTNLQGQGSTQMQIANTGAAITAGMGQQTISYLQGQNALQQQICGATGRLSQEIDTSGDQAVAAINAVNIQSLNNTQRTMDGIANVGQAVTNQGYQNQLGTKDLLAAIAAQHSDIKATIIDQGCQDRALMREIAAQQVRDELAKAQAKIVQLENQNYVNQSNSQQTLYLLSQLKGTTTPTTGA